MTLTDFKVVKRLGKHPFLIRQFLPSVPLKHITETTGSVNCSAGKVPFNKKEFMAGISRARKTSNNLIPDSYCYR